LAEHGYGEVAWPCFAHERAFFFLLNFLILLDRDP
jgi:hypothetical protein